MQIVSAEYVTSVFDPGQGPPEALPEIALAGRSNVGKSSLLNRLLNRRNLAKTSNSPGKTRALNYYRVGSGLYLVDLPGYGYAQRSQAERSRWAALVEGYLADREALKGIVHLLDARHDPTSQDLEMLRWLLGFGKPFLVVATKTDKLSGSRLKPRLDRTRRILLDLGELDLVPFSAITGRGRSAVWRWIQETLHG